MEINITERVKTFEDACEILGLDPKNIPIVEHLPEKDRKSIIAYYKLTVITRVLNEGWEPDFADYTQTKHWNWFYISYKEAEGFTQITTHTTAADTAAHLGAQLCFKTHELAKYASKQFRDLYFEYLFIDMPKNYKK